MTTLLLVVHVLVHLSAWAMSWQWLRPRWRSLLSLVVPPLVPLYVWEHGMGAPGVFGKLARWSWWAWLITLGAYLLAVVLR